jgi:hypothetical protein
MSRQEDLNAFAVLYLPRVKERQGLPGVPPSGSRVAPRAKPSLSRPFGFDP